MQINQLSAQAQVALSGKDGHFKCLLANIWLLGLKGGSVRKKLLKATFFRH